MELTPLRYFRAVAHARHMTNAARTLGVTQPALSAAMRKLEREVGTALLRRTGRGIELTEPGRVFLEHAEQALHHSEAGLRAIRELLGLEAGTIRIGGGATAITYLLPAAVSSFRREHPGLRFYLREAGSTQVAQAVASGELDLGIVTLPVALSQGDALVRTPLVEDELRLLSPARQAAEADHDRRAAGFRWKELEGRPVVGFEAGSAVRAVIDAAAAKSGVTLNYVMELRSIESIKRMVSAGIGVGFVSRFALEPDEGRACRDGKLARRLALVARRGTGLSPGAAAFAAKLTRTIGR